MTSRTLLALSLLALSSAASAQTKPSLSFGAYLSEVARANLELAARRFDVDIAEAQISIAKIFPDPALTAGLASVDVSGVGAPSGITAGLSQTIELGGKRGARVRVAERARTQAQAELEDFLRGLRAEAAVAFVDALWARLVVDRKERTLTSLENLVTVNEQRLRAGDVGEIAVVKARVESQRFRSEVLTARAEVPIADLAVALRMGRQGLDGQVPDGQLALAPRSFDAAALIGTAVRERPDAVTRRVAVEGARAKMGLAKANRWVDLSLSLSWTYFLEPYGQYQSIAPAPAFHGLGALFTLPLPFSRIYRGELNAAAAGRAQAEMQLRAVELQIGIEIRQALARYEATVEQLKLFGTTVLADADRVLTATLYNYQRGGATLLEVLDAQRTVNEVYLAYFDALRAHGHALIALEQAAGIWDLSL